MAEIVPASEQDAGILARIENACFTSPWSENSIEEALCDPKYVFLKLVCDGETVGYGGIMTVLDESDVVNIAVLPNFRGKGYGRMLLRSLEDGARKNGASLLHLEVRQSNAPAIGLYESFGFTTDGIRKNYYTKPLENAVLMTKKI
jgi:ribosomal-protein-alanine N-acetyltransferase